MILRVCLGTLICFAPPPPPHPADNGPFTCTLTDLGSVIYCDLNTLTHTHTEICLGTLVCPPASQPSPSGKRPFTRTYTDLGNIICYDSRRINLLLFFTVSSRAAMPHQVTSVGGRLQWASCPGALRTL